jgi:hypothetical protein
MSCDPQLGVAKDIVATEGVGTLYKGLSAGLLRQATYTTARLGIFNNISTWAKKNNNGQVCGLQWTCKRHHCRGTEPCAPCAEPSLVAEGCLWADSRWAGSACGYPRRLDPDQDASRRHPATGSEA